MRVLRRSVGDVGIRRVRGRLTLTAAVVALLSGAVAGCDTNAAAPTLLTPSDSATGAGAGATSPSVRSSTPTDTPRTVSPSDETSERARIRAAMKAGAPPVNLAWRVPHKPKTWTKLPKETDGLQGWFVKPGCYVWLWQYSDLGTGKKPTTRDLIKRAAEVGSAMFPGKPKPIYRSHKTIEKLNFVTGLPYAYKVKMAESIVDYGKGRSKGRSEVIAYRNGPQAITFNSKCRTVASFKKVSDSDFNAWRDTLAASTTY